MLGPGVPPPGFFPLRQVEDGRKLPGRATALNPATYFIACVCQGRCEKLGSHTDAGSQSP